MTKQDANLDEQLEEILREFLDATDYALEAPEERADDADWFDRPYKEATQAIKQLIKDEADKAYEKGLKDGRDNPWA